MALSSAKLLLAGSSSNNVLGSFISHMLDWEVRFADSIVEKAVRKGLKKPEGELTEADLGKFIKLDLHSTQITDAGLKEVAKLQNLDRLFLMNTKITDAGG